LDFSPTEDAGVVSRILDQFPVKVCVEDDALSENVRSAMSRGLREAGPRAPHGNILSIAAGGPSLEDTWRDLTGVTVAVNGSLGFLLERGVTPWACGVFDPRPHLADIIEPHPDVFFFLGSTCHPSVFDKLAGCNIVLWHPLGIHKAAVGAKYLIDGGSTMGLRWLTLGHFMGFRKFHCHGLDSSFRGTKTHAYPDYRDGMEQMELCGYQTSLNFIAQIRDWFEGRAVFDSLGDGTELKLFGDGLLQHLDRERA
jgi:hypothetical protein